MYCDVLENHSINMCRVAITTNLFVVRILFYELTLSLVAVVLQNFALSYIFITFHVCMGPYLIFNEQAISNLCIKVSCGLCTTQLIHSNRAITSMK